MKREKRGNSITLRLATGLLKRIEALAAARNRTRNDTINRLLELEVDRCERNPKEAAKL